MRIRNEHVGVRANGNFVEVAVVERCKVFAGKKANRYSLKTVSNPDKVMNELLAHL